MLQLSTINLTSISDGGIPFTHKKTTKVHRENVNYGLAETIFINI